MKAQINNIGNDDGTAMVDALMAVLITSLLVALVLTTVRQSGRMVRAAEASHQATQVTKYLLATAPTQPLRLTGDREGFNYSLSLTPIPNSKAPLCDVAISLRHKATRTRYALKTKRWCKR